MALELWEYIVILVSAELALVLVVLLTVWQYCRWNHSKKTVEKATGSEEDDHLHDLFKTKSAEELETGLPPVASEQVFTYTKPKMLLIATPESGFDMGNPPPYSSKEASFISSSQHESSTDSDLLVTSSQFIMVSGHDNEKENIEMVRRPQMQTGNATPPGNSEDTGFPLDMDTGKNDGRQRFETLFLVKPLRNGKRGTVQNLQEV